MNGDPSCNPYNSLYTGYESPRVLPTTAASDITTLTNFASTQQEYATTAVASYDSLYR